MTRSQIYQAWQNVERDVDAACWLIHYVDCTGPLADRPTNDPAVQVLLAARRHLLARARKDRRFLLVNE